MSGLNGIVMKRIADMETITGVKPTHIMFPYGKPPLFSLSEQYARFSDAGPAGPTRFMSGQEVTSIFGLTIVIAPITLDFDAIYEIEPPRREARVGDWLYFNDQFDLEFEKGFYPYCQNQDDLRPIPEHTVIMGTGMYEHVDTVQQMRRYRLRFTTFESIIKWYKFHGMPKLPDTENPGAVAGVVGAVVGAVSPEPTGRKDYYEYLEALGPKFLRSCQEILTNEPHYNGMIANDRAQVKAWLDAQLLTMDDLYRRVGFFSFRQTVVYTQDLTLFVAGKDTAINFHTADNLRKGEEVENQSFKYTYTSHMGCGITNYRKISHIRNAILDGVVAGGNTLVYTDPKPLDVEHCVREQYEPSIFVVGVPLSFQPNTIVNLTGIDHLYKEGDNMSYPMYELAHERYPGWAEIPEDHEEHFKWQQYCEQGGLKYKQKNNPVLVTAQESHSVFGPGGETHGARDIRDGAVGLFPQAKW
jgi:hypothetical protein